MRIDPSVYRFNVFVGTQSQVTPLNLLFVIYLYILYICCIFVFFYTVHYPKIQIIPSKEDDKTIMVDKNMLQISCIAQSCNSASNVLLDADDSYRRSRSSDTSSCPMNGHIIRCEYLNLFRLSTSSSSNNDNNNQKIQLTNQGIINTEFSEIMAELKIIQSNAEKLVVTMPRSKFLIVLKTWFGQLIFYKNPKKL